MALRIVFMGTPEFSVPVLAALKAAGHTMAAVYTQPPRPAGRGMAETKSPVHRFAETLGLVVLTPVNFKSEPARLAFAAHKADAAVVVAYGLILPEAILNAPRLGCFNVHASLLPRWRGAAPIQRAIMAGDAKTGVMVMRMDKGLDTGPVCLTREMAIVPGMTAGDVHDRLAPLGAEAMADALAKLERDTLTFIPQGRDGVTYAAKIDKAEARIDFTKPAAEVANHICGLSPFPGAWFEIEAGSPPRFERVKALRAHAVQASGPPGTVLDGNLTLACGEGAIRLDELQRAGKRPVTAAEFLRGLALPPGTRLTSGGQN
jgi:methionyl-tRNA formyltransferase